MNLPKLVLTDIDGVWTDGGMYYSQDGKEWKKFNTSDSAGVLFLRLLNIPVGIITGENSEIVNHRASKLGIDIVKLGVRNKLSVVKEIAESMHIALSDIAYIGDDINDIKVLKNVGFSGVPFNSPSYIQKYADIILTKNGGQGVFREFVEHILKETNMLESVLTKYLEL